MEGQYVPPAGEPQKVRNQKPRRRNPSDQGSQRAQGQQPPLRKSNRGAPQQQQPEAADWAYNQADQYGNADPAQGCPEHYGHGTGEHVDAHGYGYDGAHADAGHGYDYGHDHGYGAQGYGDAVHGYGDTAHGYGDAAHGYGDAAHGYGDAAHGYGDAAHGYSYDQQYGYDGAQVDAGQDYGYVAPTQPVKGKAKKPRKPRPVADGGEHHGAGYENQGDGYGLPGQGGYADGYAYPEAYNAAVPEPQPNQNSQKRESKHRKPTRIKSMDNADQGDGESILASRAVAGEADEVGSARSGGSNRSKPGRSDRNTSADGSGSHRHRTGNQSEQERTTTPRFNAVAGDHREGSSGRSNPERRKQKQDTEGGGGAKPAKAEGNALNELMRKTGGGRPKQASLQDVSMTVFNPHDRTAPPQAPSALGEWMKKQGDKPGPKFQQDTSLIVNDDGDKSDLETRIFGAPLPKKPPITLPPVEEQWEQPQYQQPRQGHQQRHQAPEIPPHRPARQRRPSASTPAPQAYQGTQVVEAGAIKAYSAEENKKAVQLTEPSAKCMACVHGVGVPLARLATRIACVQCRTCLCAGCTIL